jgi:2-polyprenyl-3-methyl-5-hydroxy-6-metoxy-1,4-benzoquinol methylase
MNQLSAIDFANEPREACAQSQAACLACGGALEECVKELSDTRYGIAGIYEIRRCRNCSLEQIYPVPDAAELKNLYENFYNFSGEQGTLYTNIREWLLSSSLYRLWTRLDGDVAFHRRKGTGRLLDIGCNQGRGLRIFERNGFEVEGLELSETAATVARQAGYVVHTCKLDDFAPPAPYDVVVLSNVLEHSLVPGQMLREAARVLKPGGEIWISCPNSRSWLRSCFGRFWINWHVPFHISHFSQATLDRALREAGYFGVQIHQETPAGWVASSLIVRTFFRRGKATRQLRNPALYMALTLAVRTLLFPFLSWGNRTERGDCLVAIARKFAASKFTTALKGSHQ